MKIDRRFQNGFLIMNSYTFSRSKTCQREHRHRHADRLRLELGAIQLRPHAQLRADDDLRAAVGAGQALDGREPARQDRRRLAVERPLHRAVRAAARRLAATAPCSTRRATARSPTSTARTPCSAGSDPAISTSIRPCTRCPPAGVQGNMKRNSGPEGPGFWQLDMSLFKRFSVGGSRFAEFRVDAFNATNSVALGEPQHRIQHRRPATRSARSPARRARSARSASADGSCSRRLAGPGVARPRSKSV